MSFRSMKHIEAIPVIVTILKPVRPGQRKLHPLSGLYFSDFTVCHRFIIIYCAVFCHKQRHAGNHSLAEIEIDRRDTSAAKRYKIRCVKLVSDPYFCIFRRRTADRDALGLICPCKFISAKKRTHPFKSDIQLVDRSAQRCRRRQQRSV